MSDEANKTNEEDKFFNEQAEIIFQKLNVNTPEKRQLWSKLDCIYEHPNTGAKLFIGGESAAKDEETLKVCNITRVVNCTTDIKNKFEGQGNIEYTRFCIATWEYTKGFRFNFPTDSEEFKHKEILRYADSAIDIIDGFLKDGHSVLVHCLAGAHRAGTMGVLFIMSKSKLPSTEAIKVAKQLRKLINPIARLLTFLQRVDKAVIELNKAGKLDKDSRWYRETEVPDENKENVKLSEENEI